MSGAGNRHSPADGRSQNEFVSVDSAPARFSSNVPLWRAPVLLLVFLVIAYAQLLALAHAPFFTWAFHGGDYVGAPFSGHRFMPLRVFVISYMLAFGLLSNGPILWRLGFIADMVITFIGFCALLDVTALLSDHFLEVVISIDVIEIVSGFVGYAIYAFKLLERGNMPSRVPIEPKALSNKVAITRLIAVLVISGVTTVIVENMFGPIVGFMRGIALLGGLGPGVFLFLPLTFVLLYLLGRFDTTRIEKSPFTPAVTIIVPAHNEEYIITRTIEAIDAAAEVYRGPVTILIMDNNSTDNTAKVAQMALARCDHALGRVIPETRPGKSFALNAALDNTQTEFVIRIDADTQIQPTALTFAMLRMRDPKVGVVGGLPLPPGGGPFDRARSLELMVKHGFYSVGLSAVNSVVGVPGMFACYRVELPRHLGGFVQGMNGEDTDMSLRIGELGYQLIVDPRIQFISEVPATYEHMREQRLRWFRSVFHVSARCRDLIYSSRMSMRGKLLLPFMLVNSAMRAMMVPMILFAILITTAPGIQHEPVPWRSILAVCIGAPSIIAVFAMLMNRNPRAVLHLPEYLGFRLLRSYFTLESNLTISVKDHGQHLYSPEAMERPEGKEIREA